MSGVTVGTKLDRLRRLERAVKVQISIEEKRIRRGFSAHEGTAYPAITVTIPRPDPEHRLIGPLPHPSVVRAWAVAHGYITASKSGPLPNAVLEIYREEAVK